MLKIFLKVYRKERPTVRPTKHTAGRYFVVDEEIYLFIRLAMQR